MMADETPFNPNSVTDWIAVLHNAAAVPRGHVDYDEARQVVALANRKIAFLNRSANRRDIETPDAVETARMAGLESVGGNLAALPVGAMAALAELPPAATGPLLDFISRIGGKAALDVRGVDTDAYERGVEAHPTAAAVGETVPAVLAALAGRLGAKSAKGYVSERLMAPLPEVQARPMGFTPNAASVARTAPISGSDPISRLLALLRRK